MHGPQGLLQRITGALFSTYGGSPARSSHPLWLGRLAPAHPLHHSTGCGNATQLQHLRAEEAGTHCAAACRQAFQAGRAAPPAARRGMSGLLRAPLTAHRCQTGPERSRWPATSGTAVTCAEETERRQPSGSDEGRSAGWHAWVCAQMSGVSANADTPDDLQLSCRAAKGLSCSPETALTSSATVDKSEDCKRIAHHKRCHWLGWATSLQDKCWTSAGDS